jgi:hypothetical protein
MSAAVKPKHDLQPVDADIESRFRELAQKWRAETDHLSSMSAMISNPNYQSIVALGEAVVPILLRELRNNPDYWFAALQQLTGANPVLPDHRGKLDLMAEDWLESDATTGPLAN